MYSTNRGSGVVGRLISRCSSHLLWPAKAAAVKEQTVRVTAEDADAGSKNARARYMQAKHKLGEVCPDYTHVESPMTREQIEDELVKVDAERAWAEARAVLARRRATRDGLGAVTPPLP
jgi:hypothetical protein